MIRSILPGSYPAVSVAENTHRNEELQAIGMRIAASRREQGFTQKELATLVGVSERAVQAWEAGKSHPYRHIRQLERMLGRPRDWILRGSEGQRKADMTSATVAMTERLLELVDEMGRQLSGRELSDDERKAAAAQLAKPLKSMIRLQRLIEEGPDSDL
jgi:transcriptional regulator with XRE-family HTH domain